MKQERGEFLPAKDASIQFRLAREVTVDTAMQ